MKRNSIPYRIILFVLITVALMIWSIKAKSDLNTRQDGMKITKWENFYSGNNIHFYYLNTENENLLKLKKTYGLDKVIGKNKDEFDNSIKIMEFINGKVKAQSNSMTSDKSALKIMEQAFGGTKISDNDYTTIYEESLASIGISVRPGVLRSSNKKVSGKSYFNICEIWSKSYNKWIMIDGVNGCYMTDAGIPLSAVEVISKGIDKVKIMGLKDTNKYVKNMKGYYESYSISVDNNKYGELKSNSKITFLKQGQLPTLEAKEGFIQPTIFVNNPQAFIISPKIKYVNNNADEIPTLIVAKKDLKNDTKEIENFTVGAFMNSYMLTKYFISVNGGDYIKVDTYFDLQIVKGLNSIKLSLDGKTLKREVVIEK